MNHDEADREQRERARKLRDAHQATAHGGVNWHHYGLMGKTWLGEGPPPQYAEVKRA